MTESVVAVRPAIRLAHESIGDPSAAPVVLIAGLGQQLVHWPDRLVADLAESGHRVIRFDNRDAGLSTHLSFSPPNLTQIALRHWHRDQYVLFDMAKDTVGLIDALGLDAVHLVGMSMGGMIAQTVAARFPARVRSLTSIMSNTGAPKVGRPALSTWRIMATARRVRNSEEAADAAIRIYSHIGSHGYPFDGGSVRAAAARAWDRDPDGATGALRQLGAVFKTGDRTQEIRRIVAPTLVIHGDRDRMVDPSGGAATARAVTSARLQVMTGLGHDLPAGAWSELSDVIADHVRFATGRSARR